MVELAGHFLEYGTEGCELSWQEMFPEEVECSYCSTEGARLAFVLMERNRKNLACRLHDIDPEGEGFWLHDAAAFAVYLCRSMRCRKGTIKWNQG